MFRITTGLITLDAKIFSKSISTKDIVRRVLGFNIPNEMVEEFIERVA